MFNLAINSKVRGGGLVRLRIDDVLAGGRVRDRATKRLDPSLAVSLRVGEDAAAELAAIPDSEALRTADEAITHIDVDDRREAGSRVRAEIQRMAANICEGGQPDFAHASVAELLAYCVAIEKLAWGDR